MRFDLNTHTHTHTHTIGKLPLLMDPPDRTPSTNMRLLRLILFVLLALTLAVLFQYQSYLLDTKTHSIPSATQPTASSGHHNGFQTLPKVLDAAPRDAQDSNDDQDTVFLDDINQTMGKKPTASDARVKYITHPETRLNAKHGNRNHHNRHNQNNNKNTNHTQSVTQKYTKKPKQRRKHKGKGKGKGKGKHKGQQATISQSVRPFRQPGANGGILVRDSVAVKPGPGSNYSNETNAASIAPRTLEFEVCGGLTNQRIAILTAAALARWTNRLLILPQLQEDFILKTPWVSFDSFYDSERFVENVHRVELERFKMQMNQYQEELKRKRDSGERLNPKDYTAWKALDDPSRDFKMEEIPNHITPPLRMAKNLPQASFKAKLLRIKIFRKMFSVERAQSFFKTLNDFPRLIADCGFFAMNLLENMDIANFIWQMDGLLPFNSQIESDISLIASKIPTPVTTFLHVRIEQDWVDHCKKWRGDNCYTSPKDIAHFMVTKKISNADPVYIAGILVTHPDLEYIRQRYNTTSKEMLIPKELEKYKGYRDLLAAVDYGFSKRCHIFIGNSVSTFSALLLIERQDKNLPNYHYNEGIIPLEGFLPSLKLLDFKYHGHLAWVFALGDTNPTIISMAKVAVLSAREKTTLSPICLYQGNDATLIQWMEAHGVKVIRHKLIWDTQLKGKAISFPGNASKTFPFANHEELSLSYFVTDAPMIDDIHRLNYVLYTTPDVLFVEDVRPDYFEGWPSYIACARKLAPQKIKTYDTSVMLLNLRSLRSTRTKFLAFILAQPSLQSEYGFGVHGSYSEFYQHSKRKVSVFPVALNWNPEWETKESIKLVHFKDLRPINGDPLQPKGDELNNLQAACEAKMSCVMHFKLFRKYNALI